MPFVPFGDLLPELAEQETRSITVMDGSNWGLPLGEYSFIEMFCDEPGCDCRRVFFIVMSSFGKRPETVIAYGWESREFYANWSSMSTPEMIDELQGPVLNLGSPHSDLAPGILAMAEEMLLSDDSYVDRLKRHYKMFRDKIDGKPSVEELQRTRMERKKAAQREKRKKKKKRARS